MGVVRNFPACGGESTDMGRLRCQAQEQINALTGTEYVRVVRPTSLGEGPTPGRVRPGEVRQRHRCDADADHSWIGSIIQMSIEQDARPLPTGNTTEDPFRPEPGVPMLTGQGTQSDRRAVTSAVPSPSWSR